MAVQTMESGVAAVTVALALGAALATVALAPAAPLLLQRVVRF
jgi:hypothetical protein